MAGIAADDVIVSIYFIILYALARRTVPDPQKGKVMQSSAAVPTTEQTPTILAAATTPTEPTPKIAAATAATTAGVLQAVAATSTSSEVDLSRITTIANTRTSDSAPQSLEDEEVEDRRSITVLEGATAIAVSACICALGTHIASAIGYRGGSITIITAITVALATLAPKAVAPLVKSGEGLAAILMQLFFASVGASGNIGEVLRTAPTLFAWSAVAISVHLILVLVFERVFGFSRRETCLASNANIGGPTTAAGMAAAKGWRSSMVPALLIGIMGYATATFVGVGAAQVFKQMQRVALAAAGGG